MKSCPYCGKQYPDDVLECPSDGTSLESASKTENQSTEVSKKVICPACGAADDYAQAIEFRNSFSWPIFLIGGILGLFFYNAGRRKRVRCNKCDNFFYIRTPISKVSVALFWIFVVIPIILVGVGFLLALIRSIIKQ